MKASDVYEFLTDYPGDDDFLLSLAEVADERKRLSKSQLTAVRKSREFKQWDNSEPEPQPMPIDHYHPKRSKCPKHSTPLPASGYCWRCLRKDAGRSFTGSRLVPRQ